MKKRIIKLMAILGLIQLKRLHPISTKELITLASKDQIKFINFILTHQKTK